MKKLIDHVVFAVSLLLYVLVVGQNWGLYTVAILIRLWASVGGDLQSTPFTIGKTRLF